MIVKVIRAEELGEKTLWIGHRGENRCRQFRIDCSKIFAEYPAAVPALTVKPPRGAAYPAVAGRDGDFVDWTVTDSDTAMQGNGEIQLTFTENGVVKKTCTGKTETGKSLTPTKQAPDPVENWLVEANTALNAIPQMVEESVSEAMAEAEERIEGDIADAEAWAKGTRDGEPVASDDPAYHNNSKYYKEQTVEAAVGQIQSITDEGTRQIGLVQGEGTTQVGLVQGEGTTQVGKVSGEGVTQVAAVQLKGEQTLASIPSDYTGLSNDVSDLKNEIQQKQDAPGTAGTAGQVLALDSNLDPVWSTPQSGSEIDDSAGAGVKNKTWSADKLKRVETDFETVTGNQLIEFTDGYYIATNKSTGNTVNLTPQEGSGTSSYAILNCSPGDIFTLNGTGGSTGRLWCFIDSDNKCIYTAAENLSYTNKLIQAPANASKLILNVVTTTKGMCCKNASIDQRVDDLENNLLPNDLGKGAVLLSGKYIDYRDGDLTNSSTARSTAHINISGCTKIVYSRICITTSPNAWGMAFYGSDGSYISGEKCKVSQASNHYEPTEITVPENAVYIRMTAFDDQIPYVYDADDYKAKQHPVTDVQINGTSVVTDGVANVPVMSTDGYGVAKINVDYGISMLNGNLRTRAAGDTPIKQGTNTYLPITPGYQHSSTFYGLAKASGDTTQSSSANAVGTYTDAAKISIQKMLGIYESPWELIREDTVTNDAKASIEITVDGNGQTFELTDIFLYFMFPKQENIAKKENYGAVSFYYGDNQYVNGFFSSSNYTQQANANAQRACIKIEQQKNAVFISGTGFAGSGVTTNWLVRALDSSDISDPFQVFANPISINKINISAVTGTAQYRLYGRRKWT